MNLSKKRPAKNSLFMEEKSKKFQKKIIKTNIIHTIDIKAVVEKFIKNYFNLLLTDNNKLFENKMIRYFSKFKFNGEKLIGNNIIKCFNYFKDTKINLIKYDLLDCGSRRIDIMVKCNITKGDNQFTFTQYFLLCHASDWYIMNSIII
jgi:hypothetical protein